MLIGSESGYFSDGAGGFLILPIIYEYMHSGKQKGYKIIPHLRGHIGVCSLHSLYLFRSCYLFLFGGPFLLLLV
jgi:hypothetical protein